MHWKMFAFFSRQRKLKEKLVDGCISRKYLKKAWNAWNGNHLLLKAKKIEDCKMKEAAGHVEMISMKYQKEISSLQAKLAELTAEIQASNQHKKDMQNQLKRAFMRGLCAMNLEAMDVLNPEDAARQGELVLNREEMAALQLLEKSSQPGQQRQFGNYSSTRIPEFSGQPSTIRSPAYPAEPSMRQENHPQINSLDMAIKESFKREYSAISEKEDLGGSRVNPQTLNKAYDLTQYKSNRSPEEDPSAHRDVRTEAESRTFERKYVSEQPKTLEHYVDDVDGMYENMLKEFNIRSDNTNKVNGNDQSEKENRKLTIMSEPLVPNFNLG